MHEQSPKGRLPEIPPVVPDEIAEFLRSATISDEVDMVPEVANILSKPLLDENSYAQCLFNRFRDESHPLSRGYSALTIKVFPLPTSQLDKAVLGEFEGDALIFNDQYAGYNIELRHLVGRGVVAFGLIDDQESGNNGAWASVIMQKDGSFKAHVSFLDQGQIRGYRFRATRMSQIVLSSIAKDLIASQGLEETIEDFEL